MVLGHALYSDAAAHDGTRIKRLAAGRPVLEDAESVLAAAPDERELRRRVAILSYHLDAPERALSRAAALPGERCDFFNMEEAPTTSANHNVGTRI